MRAQQERYGQAMIKWMPIQGGFAGVVILGGKQLLRIEDEREERLLSRLRNEAGRLHPDYVGFDGAVKRFLRFFPAGLRGAANASRERAYKEKASARLNTALGAEQALAAGNADAARIAGAGIQTNMLSPFEAARLRDTLLGDTGGRFVRGAAAFAHREYRTGAEEMSAAVKPHGRVSWPMVTYLPFLWDYQTHMFLKPKVTVDFADRVGHDFSLHYVSEPNEQSYVSLLDLVDKTRAAIARLEPKDNIDVQSFIWVVGEYRDEDAPSPEL